MFGSPADEHGDSLGRPGRDLEIHDPLEYVRLLKWTWKGVSVWAATVSAIESRPQQVPAGQSSKCCAAIALNSSRPLHRVPRWWLPPRDIPSRVHE